MRFYDIDTDRYEPHAGLFQRRMVNIVNLDDENSWRPAWTAFLLGLNADEELYDEWFQRGYE